MTKEEKTLHEIWDNKKETYREILEKEFSKENKNMKKAFVKRNTYSINEIKEALKNEVVKEIRLEYIWCNICEICREPIRTYDEEYSLDIIKNEGITENFLEEEIKYFEENYFEIDRDSEQYYLVMKVKETGTLIFYKENYDYSDKERCEICERLI